MNLGERKPYLSSPSQLQRKKKCSEKKLQALVQPSFRVRRGERIMGLQYNAVRGVDVLYLNPWCLPISSLEESLRSWSPSEEMRNKFSYCLLPPFFFSCDIV